MKAIFTITLKIYLAASVLVVLVHLLIAVMR